MAPYNNNVELCMIIAASWLVVVAVAGKFSQDTQMYFGQGREQVSEGGNMIALKLDKESGSGFFSTKEYLFGRFDMDLKLAAGFTAGTVTTFYLTSPFGDGNHDEIDFEFLGNVSGQPYTVHTNVFGQGKGSREQQFHLWFDPSAEFHTYTILWNAQKIFWIIDHIPIRVYNNPESIGVPYPKSKPMRVFCSIWEAGEWATQGGKVKTDWSRAPFIAYYRNFNDNACVVTNGVSSCNGKPPQPWQTKTLDVIAINRLKSVQQKNMIYNYCTDAKRFPQGFPVECTKSTGKDEF